MNAFQRGATVVIQKPLKEGFGLAVSEALWKGKAGRVETDQRTRRVIWMRNGEPEILLWKQENG